MTQGESPLFENLAGTKVTYDKAMGAVFSIKTDQDSPTMQSHKYMFFGRVDVTMQSAPGPGIVTSFVLQSDDLDEIDIEFVGGDNAQFQSNYFSKGDTSTYDRGAYHPVANPAGQFHTYSLVWSKDSLQWLLDGAVIRTLAYNDAKGGATYPQTPMQIKFGTWVAGRPGAPEGTVTWAGGLANFANAPFNAYYKEIKITDNAGGITGAKQYIYSDQSGTWQSIKIDTVNGPDPKSSSSSVPASTSKTAAPSTLSTMTTASAQTTASTTGAGVRTTTSSAPSSSSTVPAPNAAGKAAFTVANAAVAGLALVAANFFLL